MMHKTNDNATKNILILIVIKFPPHLSFARPRASLVL